MTIRSVLIPLLLSAGLASADQIRIDHREGTTGNYSPIPLTTTPNYVLTFDVNGNPVIGPAAGTGSIATDTLWNAAGDLAVGTGADTATRLARGTALQVLRVNAAASALEWATAASGGNVATDVIFDAKGDLVVGTGADTSVRLATGTNNYVLTADSATATGLKWAAATGGASLSANNTWTGTNTFGNVTASAASVWNLNNAAVSLGGTFAIPTGNDPDVTIEGQISYDANGDVLRGFDGTNQIALGRKIEAIHCTVVLPNDLADSERDAFWIWENVSGMSFVITGWKGKSDTDDTTLAIKKSSEFGTSIVTVDTVEIALNGTGLFYATDPDGITSATIANGNLLYLDFDDTDTPGQVKMTIYGYYDANVN